MREQGTYQKGMAAEVMAMALLMMKGYRILNWRYKTRVGEIDVIARRRNTLAFIEVKRRSSLSGALESLTPHMRRRITRAARYYIGSYPHMDKLDQRFDLIAVSGFSVRHLDNAWMDAP
jgi:putative endonuclease